jgi:hemolysin activation/secretion protein
MLDIAGSYRKYFELSGRFHASADVAGKISTNPNQPYFYQSGFGYGRTFVRGYELFVIDGQSYLLLKNTVKYSIIPTKVKKIGFIGSDKFGKIHYALYLNVFFDVGYVRNYVNYEYNNLSNKLLFGTGIGIDLVTYYDLVLRLEYTVNRQGQTGFYIHFKDTL